MARILVIEDHAVNLALMTYLLKAYQHEVIGAIDGEQGLALARESVPDLVLLDVELPGMSGIDVARALRADVRTAHVPLLAVTASAMRGDRERLMSMGFDGYASKPIDPKTFNGWIEGFLRPAAAPGDAGQPLLLVVDDVPANLLLKRSCLVPLGFRVLTAHRPDEALAMARYNPPDLILSDVGMPEGGGFDFIQQVKQVPALRDVPFIFITSTHHDSVMEQQALALGATRYLMRPLSPEQLVAEVRACLRRPPAPAQNG
ncbi:MAG: response regulator [Aquincola tertiaricarbonis]|uniref:response regulator n=1 Tax=Aquincola TaxID=391952 RepID=UPI0018DDD83C|nr:MULTISPECIES: response regulator [Aquincola]